MTLYLVLFVQLYFFFLFVQVVRTCKNKLQFVTARHLLLHGSKVVVFNPGTFSPRSFNQEVALKITLYMHGVTEESVARRLCAAWKSHPDREKLN